MDDISNDTTTPLTEEEIEEKISNGTITQKDLLSAVWNGTYTTEEVFKLLDRIGKLNFDQLTISSDQFTNPYTTADKRSIEKTAQNLENLKKGLDERNSSGFSANSFVKKLIAGAVGCYAVNTLLSLQSFQVASTGNTGQGCIWDPLETALKEAIVDILVRDVYTYISTGGIYGTSLFKSSPRRFFDSLSNRYLDLVIQDSQYGSLINRFCHPFDLRFDLAVNLGGGFDFDLATSSELVCTPEKIRENINNVKKDLRRSINNAKYQVESDLYFGGTGSPGVGLTVIYTDLLELITDPSLNPAIVYHLESTEAQRLRDEEREKLIEDSVANVTPQREKSCLEAVEKGFGGPNKSSSDKSDIARKNALSSCEQIASASTIKESQISIRTTKINEILGKDGWANIKDLLTSAFTRGIITRLFVEDPTTFSSLPAEYGDVTRKSLRELANRYEKDPEPALSNEDFNKLIADSLGGDEEKIDLFQTLKKISDAITINIDNFIDLSELVEQYKNNSVDFNTGVATLIAERLKENTSGTTRNDGICDKTVDTRSVCSFVNSSQNIVSQLNVYLRSDDGNLSGLGRNLTGKKYNKLVGISNEFNKSFENILTAFANTKNAFAIYVENPTLYGAPIGETEEEKLRVEKDIQSNEYPIYLNFNIEKPNWPCSAGIDKDYPIQIYQYRQTSCSYKDLIKIASGIAFSNYLDFEKAETTLDHLITIDTSIKEDVLEEWDNIYTQ